MGGGGGQWRTKGGGTCRGVGRTELGGGGSGGGGPTTVDCPPKRSPLGFTQLGLCKIFYFFFGGGGSGQPGNPPGYTLGKGGGVQGGGMGASLGGGARPACIGANLKAALSIKGPAFPFFFCLSIFVPGLKGRQRGALIRGGGRWRPSGRHLGGGVWGSPQGHF